ncbi:ankyrin repeat domain-containing protein 26 isoform X1 [Salmo salar]|uniref:Golgin subfamily B member 1 isoform X1 n=1 Tax=Salmo salar TaxID=8030 RepID=A0A1S3KL76_SALSA|nr:golgin subfamily B member 1 isoform X1 [Salmo salar]XP_045543984.1 golgin subfamily B member 1 isoform X1 [Salmo salar]XP_045543985.1 golgin subfamily B member 1 isoform X1 [Salmo salar]XP_045543986.1 golgin subfamily B member 1 isoform X1 [Salmo salar]
MKKIFNFTKKKKGFSPNTSDTGSVLSVGYDLKEKDLGKVHKAAYGGDLAKLKQLAKKNDINQLDKENRTALHIACANGHTDVVQFLVESKAKLNLCDNQNRSPLMKAVQCQQERCVATLLEHDAEPNLVDVNGNTALHLASCIPAFSTAMLLLEHEANVNAQNKEGYSPLTMAVKENHAEMAEFLLKEGADVNTKDQGHRSPLMIAACNGQISMVRLLLQYDADITLKDNNGWSSDDYAVMNGHHACSHLIIEHGTKRKSMPSPAHAPAKKKQASMLCSPSEEAGFSLGGPATDKDEQGASEGGRDVEDNSQTESISRASKSAADDSWPSSDEEDELDITPKKHPKLNLKKLMNASKKGKNDEYDRAELEETQGSELSSEQPSGSKARGRDSPEESPEGDNEDDDEEDEDDDEDDKDYEDEDDDDDEEEDEDDDDDYEEEQEGEEEEECDVAATSVKAEGIGAEEVPKTSSAEAVDIVDEDDQTISAIKVSDTVVADSEHVDPAGEMGAPKNVSNAESQANERMVPEILFGTSNYGIPATLDVEEDCVVSAIRVESRFSDEEDSLGYELNGTSDHKFVPEAGFPAVPKTPPHSTGVLPSQRNWDDFDDDDDEEGIGEEDAPADYWSDEAKLIADDKDIRETLDHTSTLGEPKNTSTVSHGETHRSRSSDDSFDSKNDDDDDDHDIAKLKVDKCKSSWYSHSDENDKVDGASTTKEDEIIDEIPHLEGEDLISDFQLESSTSPVQSISPKCISLKPKVDEPKYFWNSSSDDNVKKGASPIRDECLEVHASGKLSPSLSVASPRIRAEDQQRSDDSWEDEDVVDEVEEMPNDDASPAESPEPGEKKAAMKESFDDDLPLIGEQVEDKNKYDDDDDYYVNRDVAATGSLEPEEAIAPIQHKTDENSPRKWTSPPRSPRREIKDMDNLERGPSTPRDLLSLISRPPSANEQRLTSRDLLSPISRPTSKILRPANTNERKLTPRDSQSPISRPESTDGRKLKPRDSRSPISRSTSALSRSTTADEEMLSKGADELDISQPQKDVESDESVPVSMIDDWQDEKEMADDKGQDNAMNDKDKEGSEDTDSQNQKLQYDFASGTIKVPDEGNDSHNTLGILGEEDIESFVENYDVISGRLPVTPIKHSLETRKMFGNTSSEDEAASDLDSEDDPTPDAMNAAQTPIEDIDEISDEQGGLDQETTDQNDPGETHEDKPEKDAVELQSTHSKVRTYVTAVQQHESDMSDGFSDQEEELPQTDIDDVDVDSPFEDEPEYVERATLEVRDNEDPVKGINLPIKWEKDSTEDEEDYDEDRGGDEEDEEEKSFKEEMGKTKYQTEEEKDDSLVDDSPVPGSEDTSKEKQRDFLSELGLEKGDDEEDSWDTESGSVSPRKQHGRDPAKMPHVSVISGENKEVLRNYDNDADNDNVPEKPEKIKRETLSILTKLELSKKDADKKTDIMEELGLGDVDDLEEAKKNRADASDWDTASTASRRTLPGHEVPSPGGEELRVEASSRSPIPLPAVQEPDAVIAERSGPEEKRDFLSERPLPLASPRCLTPQTQPQPCARKMLLQRTESEKDFDWDSDHVNTSTPSTGKQLPNVTETIAVLKPNNPVREPSPVKQESECSPEPEEQAQEEKDVASELDVSNPYQLDPVGSQTVEEHEEYIEKEGRYVVGESEGDGKEEEEEPGWQKRYGKIWVELEKREVKSSYRNVAAELKEKFGKFPAESASDETTEEEEKWEENVEIVESPARTTEEESSNKELGEPMVCPLSRARRSSSNAVLLTILEQRGSGLEDSLTKSADNSNSSPNKDATTKPKPAAEERWPGQVQQNDEKSPSMYEEETEVRPSQSQPPSLSNVCPPAPFLPSDEELEEDLQRFKHEVGMLKVVFLDLEKEKALLWKEVGEDKTKANMEVLQKSSASRVAGGSMSRRCERELDEEEEKPETSLGHPTVSRSGNGATESEHLFRATDRITQRHWSKSPKRALEDQLHHQQQKKEEGRAVSNEATLQLPFLGGARHGPAPQAANHVNAGDPLSVFDDSTLSQVSDDDGRSLSAWHQKDKTAGEMEMAEDFDELTQSSDTATSDLEDPTSGYRHASFLIKQLDSATLDSVSIVKLQNMFHEYERTIQRERGRHGRLSDKVSQLEAEQCELMASLEESRDSKQALDHRQLELDTDLNNFKFQLKQEQEKHRNASMLYDKTREMLRRKEEELRAEAEEKHKVELAMRNLELEMRAILNNMKQSEEDRSETQRLLTQERGARALSETLLNNHLRKQQEIEEENRRTVSKSNEALSQLTEATDRERELLQQSSVLQDELSSLRAELERSCSHSRQEESRHSEESEALRERLEDARRDLKLNEEALAQTVYQYTSQVTTVKAELAVASTRLEHERQAREQLEAEGESARTRLIGALQEAERCQAARADAERALHREREGHQRAQDKLMGEAANKREAVGGLSQKLAKAESRANSLENEVHRITMSLAEMEHVVATLQRDKDQIGGRVKELEAALQTEREQAGRVCARQETLQERLAAAQSEAMLLRQQLEGAQNKGMAKEKAVTDAQERFGDLLAKLRSDGEERVQLVEERSKELATKAADLRDQVYKLEEEKNDRETGLRQLQQELADSLKKLSMSEASLEVNTRYRNDLEEEKARLLKDMDRLKGKLEESEDQYVQAERRIKALKSSLDEKEREVVAASQKLQEVLSAFAGSDTTIKQLEEAVQRLEIENARLEAAAKQQTNKIEALQKGVQDSAMPSDSAAGGGVRNRLEDLVTGLQCSKMTLEDQLSQEVQKQSMLSHNAQDSHALWEEELKSRSKLGLRLAELEKEKGELSSQMELEKKKAKKIAEQKKSVDTRLDQEMKRNTELQKEMYRLRTLVKTAKKKLREQDGAGAEFGSPMSSMRGEMGHRQTEADIGRMKDKVDDLSVQLEKEVSRCSQLERINGELKEQLASLKGLGRSNERLERSKRHLEEELLGLRRQVEAGVMDQTLVDQYRRDAEERARQEIRQKLEEVNLFLQTQAASQEALEQIKAANEASLRSTLEQRIRELEGELGRAHSTQHDSMSLRDSTRTELDRYRELYTEELRLRKALAAKLERSNERLAEANTKLMSERHRSKSLIASSIVNGSLGGPLDMGSLGSVGAYGATLGPLNRSLGGPLLSPLGDGGQSSRVEAYLAKMQNELERNISKELDHATVELEGSARMSPVGSASGSPTSLGWGLSVVEDPVSRATQQYLEVLKKNYMI